MIGVPLTKNIITTTTPDELQVRNELDHKRVYDPDSEALLSKILIELQKMNVQFSIITDEEI